MARVSPPQPCPALLTQAQLGFHAALFHRSRIWSDHLQTGHKPRSGAVSGSLRGPTQRCEHGCAVLVNTGVQVASKGLPRHLVTPAAACTQALAAVTAAELAAMPISPRLNGAARRKAHGRPSQQRRAAAAAAAAAALAQARATVQAQAAAAAEEEQPAAAAPAQPAAPARASNPAAGGGMRRKATADRHLHREVSLGSDSIRSGRGISKSSSGSGSGLFGTHGKPGRFHFLLEALGRLNGTSPCSPGSAAAQGSSRPSVSKWFSPRGPQTPSILSVSPERFQTSMAPAPELLAPPLPLFT